jgi:hypothetical protein
LRTVRRPRRYVGRHWLTLLAPAFSYNHSRDAYVMRGIGRHLGPVLRADRRASGEADRRIWSEQHLEGLDPGERLDRRRGRRTSIA